MERGEGFVSIPKNAELQHFNGEPASLIVAGDRITFFLQETQTVGNMEIVQGENSLYLRMAHYEGPPDDLATPVTSTYVPLESGQSREAMKADIANAMVKFVEYSTGQIKGQDVSLADKRLRHLDEQLDKAYDRWAADQPAPEPERRLESIDRREQRQKFQEQMDLREQLLNAAAKSLNIAEDKEAVAKQAAAIDAMSSRVVELRTQVYEAFQQTEAILAQENEIYRGGDE